ncbi:MAG: COR domain-containing protein [bacterium]
METRRNAGVDYLSLDEYLALCVVHGFKARTDKLLLSGYLHDIGVCLHFQDGGLLEKTVILDPEWGTDAVYRVLDHRPIVDARGRFTRAQLADVWTEDRYQGMHGELLALMRRFELCYPLPGDRGYIAPQLLGRERPDYRLPSGSGLTLLYRYDFMPKGIITRFIVATHDLIADQTKVWRSGVVLRRGEAWCEVVEDYPGREIAVRVVGDDRAPLLGIVDREIERIHQSFERGLRYGTWVPCDCEACRGSAHPEFHAYDTLLHYARAGESVKCHRRFQEVDAARLLDRTLPERRTQTREARDRGHAEPAARAAEAARAAGEVFVSYAWACEASTALVEQVHARCAAEGIAVQRDRDAVRYRESFRPFMERLGAGRCVVVVLSGDYFRSAHCMHELLTLADHPEARARVYLIHAEPHTCDPEALVRYIQYWEAECARFDTMLKSVRQEHLGGLRDEMDLRATIRARLATLHGLLADMNALDAAVHGDGELDGLVAALRDAMGRPAAAALR